jgi:RNA 3'-terminal phosphate cyclase (ATP)
VLQIDGSVGAGGGQILRTAIALSLLTRPPFEMVNIRASRARPGLRPQHLQAVKAALAIGRGRAEGADPESQRLVFEPGHISGGRYQFDIGTAGSTSLILQTVYLPLAFTGEQSRVQIRGGTHVPLSPCFHYVDLHWRRFLEAMGLPLTLIMTRAGFYPRGGGVIEAVIEPLSTFRPLELVWRGALSRLCGISAVGNLPAEVAQRQRHQALARLAEAGHSCTIDLERLSAVGRGTMFLLLAEFEGSQACFFSLGKRGKRAEAVADDAIDAFLAFLETDGAVDSYCADQLLLPLALADDVSVVRTAAVTPHLLTNAEVIGRFLPVSIEIEGEMGAPGLVRVRP